MVAGYKTKQRTFILALLKEHRGRHFTAEEIVVLLEQRGNAVGKATVYRCLERLIEQGNVKKYLYGEGKSACYEYQPEQHHAHYHLKCELCGALTHMECEFLDKLPEHVYAHHGFTLDAAAIVLVGHCARCTQDGNPKDGQPDEAHKACQHSEEGDANPCR